MRKYNRKFNEKRRKYANLFTHQYFEDLVFKVLSTQEAEEFIDYGVSTYGDEWWYEWLGSSEQQIIRNIKEVMRAGLY